MALVACQEAELPRYGTEQYASEDLEVWASKGSEACGGTYDYLEQWLAAFRARAGERGQGEQHTFYWLSPVDFATSPCPTGNTACAYPFSNVIYSTVIPAEHELVHTELDLLSPSVLSEGAAEVFGSIESPFTTEVADLAPLLDDEQIPGVAYQTAGRFSRYIIEKYGLEAYFELMEALDGATGHEALETEVHYALGVELSELVDDFNSFPACSVDRWRYFDHECSMPLTPWQDPSSWTDEVDLACSAGDVIGPRDGLAWTLRALEVPQSGIYFLSIESADESTNASVFPCNVSCFDGQPRPVNASVSSGHTAPFFMEAGRHWMRVEHMNGSDASATVTLQSSD